MVKYILEMNDKGRFNMLKKGEVVVMHTCGEAEHANGKLWICQTDQFTSSSNTQVVFLNGFSGYFMVDYLQKVRLETIRIECMG